MDRKFRFCRLRSALTCRIVGGSLRAAVPRTIVTFTVAVFFAVGFVVLFIVRDQIVKRKAVMSGDEVDAGIGPPSGPLVEIGAAGEAVSKLTQRLILPAPIIAHAIAILAVPLQPQRRKFSHLVTAFANIPRLGDKLDLADHRILLNDVEKSRKAIDVVQLRAPK